MGAPPAEAKYRFEREVAIGDVTLNPALPLHVARARDRIHVLVGYYLPAMLATALLLGSFRRRWCLYTDTVPPPGHDSGLPRWQQRIGSVAGHWCLTRSTALLTTGQAGIDALQRHGVDRSRIFSIPFVVDHDRIRRSMSLTHEERERTRSELGVAGDERLLVFVGRLVELKCIDLLLRALAQAQRADRVRLLIIGDGEEKPKLQALAAELGLERRATFLPAMANEKLPTYWNAADAFVIPSRQDAWPVVVVEALVAGLPVLGSDACGSVRDRVQHRRNGWVFAKGDTAQLSALLEEFGTVDASVLAHMSRAAISSMEPWAPSAVAQEFVAMIDEVARRNATAPG
jgi:glycosyltransferase involved in cell wall biosynthesis